MSGNLRKAIVGLCIAFVLVMPLAGTASAHHKDDHFAVDVLVPAPDPVGPVGFTVSYQDDGEESVTGTYVSYVLAGACFVPVVVTCRDLPAESPDDDDGAAPLPELPPLPSPPYLF